MSRKQHVIISVLVILLVICVFILNYTVFLSFNKEQTAPIVIPAPMGVLESPSYAEATAKINFSNEQVDQSVIRANAEPEIYIDFSNTDKGIVNIKITGVDDKKLCVSLIPVDVEGKSEMVRQYKEGYYPLIFGSNEYELVVFAEKTDGMLIQVYKTRFDAEFDQVDAYRYSNVYSCFDDDSALAAKAYELTYGAKNDAEKAEIIANYIMRTVKYSDSVFDETNENLADVDSYYERGAGVCYHFAALFSGMMKSIGIPTREVRGELVGYKDVHSWNEYYCAESDSWIEIDARIKNGKYGYEFRKDPYSER